MLQSVGVPPRILCNEGFSNQPNFSFLQTKGSFCHSITEWERDSAAAATLYKHSNETCFTLPWEIPIHSQDFVLISVESPLVEWPKCCLYHKYKKERFAIFSGSFLMSCVQAASVFQCGSSLQQRITLTPFKIRFICSRLNKKVREQH